MYEVYLESRAERDLKRLSQEALSKVVDSLAGLPSSPRPAGSRKLVGSANDWRIRVGEYRILYEIDDQRRTIRVFRIRHRREAYR